MSSQGEKKRPPPIHVPEPAPALPRITPGPNAFAIAAKAKQEKTEKVSSVNIAPMVSPLDCSPQKRKDSSALGSAMTTFTQIMEAARSPRKSDVSSTSSRHGSKRSHRSRRSAVSSQPGNTEEEQGPPARLSNRSRRSSAGASQLGQIDEEQAKKMSTRDERKKTAKKPWEDEKRFTPRAGIEARHEKKLFKMMGQNEENYEGPVAPPVRYVGVDNETKPDTVKSPKKKIFGMSLPTFGKSVNDLLPPQLPPPPPMPSKAAQVLGTASRPTTSPAPPRYNTPQRPLRQAPPRSESSKSLPVKIGDEARYTSRRQDPYASVQSRHRTPIRKTGSPTRKTSTMANEQAMKMLNGSSSDIGEAPTPPKKDTPPDEKSKGKSQKGDVVRVSANKESAKVNMPNFLSNAAPVPSEGGQSPTKFCPFSAEEYIKLIETQSIVSAHAQIEDGEVAVELEGDTLFNKDDSDLQQKYPDWWDEARQNRFSQHEKLPPAFYSPSAFSVDLFEGGRPSQNSDPERLLFAFPKHNHPQPRSDSTPRGSIDMVFQGSANEIDPTSSTGQVVNMAAQKHTTSPQETSDASLATRVMQELHLHDKPASGAGAAGGQQTLLPEPSSSQLTDMLSGLSPPKSGFNHDSYGNFPSAVPSPLHMPHPPMAPHAVGPSPNWSGMTLSDGSNILTHFYMCNDHIDVLGRTLFDLVADGRRVTQETAKEILDKANDTSAVLEQRFEDIKADITAVGRAVEGVERASERVSERVSEQSQAINAKLDKVLAYLKEEVVERMAKQSKKNADLENNVKALQKTVQELQKSVETKLSPSALAQVPPPGQVPFSSQLPQHRSQPSLGSFEPYNSGREMGGFRGNMPSITEARNDGRFRYNNHGNTPNTGSQQQWFRPPTAGRENKDENSPFQSSHPYAAASGDAGQYGGYMNNGYGSYYQTGPNEHTFSYNNPGTSK